MEAIRSRRSIRRYGPTDVPDALVRELIDAARHAPSAHNSQPWAFIVVRDGETRERLSRTHRYSRFLRGAPVVIVVLGDERLSPSHLVEDCSAAVENMLIAANALGLGACWVAVYSATAAGREEYVRDLLSIPGHMRVIAMVGVGYPGEAPPPKAVRPLDEITHLERW